MPLIRPFAGLRPAPGRAADVSAPPYDVLNSEEAKEKAKGKPYSFLHISKPEIDLPEGTNPYDDSVYAKGLENLNRIKDEGVLIRDEKPCYYVYRIIMGDHTQTGLVVAASAEAYSKNLIKKHEFTRPDKENDRVRQVDTLNAQTGPVLLTCKPSQKLNEIIAEVATKEPVSDVTTEEKVQHTIWLVDDNQQIEAISTTFDVDSTDEAIINRLYIADGHHRSAAGTRVAEARKAANPDHTGDESYNYFLSVIFPSDQMEILDYNRVIKDLNGLSEEEFLKKVEENFRVQKADQQLKPTKSGEFGMYLSGTWYQLNIKEERVAKEDCLKSLDVSILADNLIEPILGITDPRRDTRIDFVGGIRGLSELEKRVNSGEMVVAFALYPTQLEELMSVADANEVMPPKSTWFEPKLEDGLVSHVLD